MSKQNRRLLYIEDDEHLCSLFTERMQEDGYSVDFALTAKSGTKKFYSGSYDLVALDYSIPDKLGLEGAKKFLSSNPEMPGSKLVRKIYLAR